jgi:hypothetical protein
MCDDLKAIILTDKEPCAEVLFEGSEEWNRGTSAPA